MSGDRFRRARELFLECVDLDEAARAAFVAARCADDPELARELRGLLDADRDGGGVLDRPPPAAAIDESAWVGREFGNYRVTGVIASGGMGVVFAARQKAPDRAVALKVIRSGMPSREALQRFRRESQALARLDHPDIATVYEAGTADLGLGPQPYIAMELVDGEPVTHHARRLGLDAAGAARLFARIARAVDHAHRHHVVHRDLKPANILVGPDGRPKVLDFGVARITDADVHATLQSEAGQMLGTLVSMSPEQLRGDHDAVDARTDVYALGVLMYEVLAGAPPQPVDERNLAEAVRVLETVPAPSLTDRAPGVPAALGVIVGKCLEKDAARRYGSAALLADDLERFLAAEPIAARPPSTAYQVRSFAARNRGLTAGLAIAALALVLGLGVSVRGWVAADRARRAADREAARAAAVSAFLTDMLEAPDPWAEGGDVKVAQVLGRASSRVDSLLADQPDAAARVHATLGTTYEGLGLYEEAGGHHRRAYALTRGIADDLGRVTALRNLLQFEVADGRLAEADALVAELEAEIAALAPRAPARAEALHVRGTVAEARGELEAAAAAYRDALELSEALPDTDPESILATRMNLAVVLLQLERAEEALPLAERVFQERERTLGTDHPSTLIAVNNLAAVYRALGRHEDGLAMARLSLDVRTRVHGPDSPYVIAAEHNLALQLGDLGRYQEALPHHRRAVAVAEAALGADHPRRHIAAAALGHSLARLDRLDEAEPVLRGSLEGLRAAFGPDHWRVRTTQGHLEELAAARSRNR
ncbi:MAG TPA: tetratricopeptide repeat protein [Candidatus Krumholzibacteria bacterium]|nr:tetratricopeptide repeat protein [Candidatus Krumholzibacteria bacterium]